MLFQSHMIQNVTIRPGSIGLRGPEITFFEVGHSLPSNCAHDDSRQRSVPNGRVLVVIINNEVNVMFSRIDTD